MADNNKWLQRVLIKLNKLFLDGSDFDDRRWVFDWDDKLSTKENLANVSDEDRALETLRQANVIRARCDENWYRNQVIQAQEELEIAKSVNPKIPKEWTNTVWGDWQTTDPAHREYDYIWFVDGFDYERFQQFCDTHGFSNITHSADHAKRVDASRVRVEQTSYDPASGVLNIMGQKVMIIAQKNKIGKKNESKQAKLMRELFAVNTFPEPIPIRGIYSVRGDTYPQEIKKKARELVAEINRKIGEETSVKDLVNCDKWKFYIRSRYLKN